MKPKNILLPYSLRMVSGPHTANFTANPTTTTVSSYLTVTETYQPRQAKMVIVIAVLEAFVGHWGISATLNFAS